MGDLADPAYQAALEGSAYRLRTLTDSLYAAHGLTALIAPVNAPAWKTDGVSGDRFGLSSSSLAAITGYPSVVVPAGYVSGLPINIAFIGPALSEDTLIQLAYVFEQAARVRVEPAFLPTIEVQNLIYRSGRGQALGPDPGSDNPTGSWIKSRMTLIFRRCHA